MIHVRLIAQPFCTFSPNHQFWIDRKKDNNMRRDVEMWTRLSASKLDLNCEKTAEVMGEA